MIVHAIATPSVIIKGNEESLAVIAEHSGEDITRFCLPDEVAGLAECVQAKEIVPGDPKSERVSLEDGVCFKMTFAGSPGDPAELRMVASEVLTKQAQGFPFKGTWETIDEPGKLIPPAQMEAIQAFAATGKTGVFDAADGKELPHLQAEPDGFSAVPQNLRGRSQGEGLSAPSVAKSIAG